MRSDELRKQHLKSFTKLSLSERLSWSLGHARFLAQFMSPKAKRINKKIRRHGKKYFKQ